MPQLYVESSVGAPVTVAEPFETVARGAERPGTPFRVTSEKKMTELVVIAVLVMVPVPAERVIVPLEALAPPLMESVLPGVATTRLPRAC